MSRLTDELMNSAPWASTEERAEWWRNKCYEVFEELEHYRHLEEQGRLIVQKHGRWIPNKIMIKSPDANNYHCSECTQVGIRTTYCPNCGAKMDEAK